MTHRSTRTVEPGRCRRDGWTAERQVLFLAALANTRSVTVAARAAGMSRESAYRLRERASAALFAHLWDQALEPESSGPGESHTSSFTNGQLARRLGTHYRRERGDFAVIGVPRSEPARGVVGRNLCDL